MSSKTNAETPMTIYNRVKILIAEKEMREGRKWPYRAIAEATGISTSTLSNYALQNVARFDASTLNALCHFFNCQPGEILIFDSDDPWKRAGIADQVATDEDYPPGTRTD